MNKYEVTTQRKKEAIIKAALSLFGQDGYTHVTIKAIAARAGVSQVSIYNYFGSKESLFDHCVEVIVQGAMGEARLILWRDMDFTEKLKLALVACSIDVSRCLLNHFSKKALEDPVLMELLMDSVNRRKREIYWDYIEFGKREGAIDKILSTDIILSFMEALSESGVNRQIDRFLTADMQQLYHLLLYGLVGKARE